VIDDSKLACAVFFRHAGHYLSQVACAGRAVSCVLTVSSNEGTPDDWEIIDAKHVRLRAERLGNGSGRICTLTVTCTDAVGNATVRTANVLVPHNQ